MNLLSLVLVTALAGAPAPQAPDATDAADAAARAWGRQLVTQLQSSRSARDRALSTQLVDYENIGDAGDISARATVLREAAQAAPGDRLVQWLWATAGDQESGCDVEHPCPERRTALARLEPDNAAAWIPLGATLAGPEHAAGRSEVLAQMGRASHADYLFGDMVDALMDVYARYPMPVSARRQMSMGLESDSSPKFDPSAISVAGVSAIARAAATDWPISAFSRHCKAEALARPESKTVLDCRHLGRLMAQGPSLVERALGIALLGTSGAEDLEARRQLDWLQWHFGTNASALIRTSAEFDHYLEDLRSTRSEVRAVELLLERHGIPVSPPVGWQLPGRAPAVAPTTARKP